jgi:hypothetical protein
VWFSYLSTFLRGNRAIRELSLSIQTRETRQLDLRFLNYAIELTHLTISEEFLNASFLDNLLYFIQTHNSLQSVSLKNINLYYSAIPAQQFLRLYQRLVSSIQINTALKTLTLNFHIDLEDMLELEFMVMFSQYSEVLVGRVFSINGIPVERVVGDLRGGLPSSAWVFKDAANLIIGEAY